MNPSMLLNKLEQSFSLEDMVKTLGLLSQAILSKEFNRELKGILSEAGVIAEEIELGLVGISEFLKTENLETKLVRELGGINPFALKRIQKGVEEAWAPLGLLVHVTPSNAWTVPFLSGVEGLLSGNVNFLKLSSSDSDFTLKLIEKLNELATHSTVKDRMIAQKISSKDTAQIQHWLNHADGVVAWGGEETIASLKKMTPAHARFIDWGHKISFSYFTQKGITAAALEALAIEVCSSDQQACSAPQVVYLENATVSELELFAQKIAQAFERKSPLFPALVPSVPEQSEITVVARMQELKKAKGEGDVIRGEGWRILIDPKSALRPSPLYRSLWVKPLKRSEIISTLRPMKAYLQTLGLSALPEEERELSHEFFKAGVLRITPVGLMQESYLGEPHDGVYALNRYVKRISLRSSLPLSHRPIMGKADFQALTPIENERELTFRSGGSSGDPKFSYFTYDDYHSQMRLSGLGLLQAGLDVKTDKVMNLFYAGGLYGGFISFFTILESIRAHQLPMAALNDQTEVAKSIVMHNANTLIGMPSYILSLFQTNSEILKEAKVVKKIFYGGEHLQSAQAQWLRTEFGVELIKSAAYGSVDAGPLGYQCRYQEGSRHHLHTDAHDFEIVEIDRDLPAQEGRLLVTTRLRGNQKIERYDLGDLVRRVEGDCACGRKGLVVDLLGRHGDVFRVGASFFNYAQFSRLLSEQFHYDGEFQIVLKPRNSQNREEMIFCLEDNHLKQREGLREALVNAHHDLQAAVKDERVLDFSIRIVSSKDFLRNASSGKLVHIIDERKL